jgi:hypothetical protein
MLGTIVFTTMLFLRLLLPLFLLLLVGLYVDHRQKDALEGGK